MSLNIKNEEVHEAVRALAQRLGVSQTSAVEVAVRARLAELDDLNRREDRAHRIREAVTAAQEAFAGVDLDIVDADLYDTSTGLPR